jgi:hypothetical protein
VQTIANRSKPECIQNCITIGHSWRVCDPKEEIKNIERYPHKSGELHSRCNIEALCFALLRRKENSEGYVFLFHNDMFIYSEG